MFSQSGGGRGHATPSDPPPIKTFPPLMKVTPSAYYNQTNKPMILSVLEGLDKETLLDNVPLLVRYHLDVCSIMNVYEQIHTATLEKFPIKTISSRHFPFHNFVRKINNVE